MTAEPESTVTLADVVAARERIAGLVRLTPLVDAVSLGERLGISLALKCENLQRTGSFKPRGAANMLAAVPRPAGVVAASAGNHAQGVALAARAHRLPITVVMPAAAPLAKRQATEGYGAGVVLADGPLATAIAQARAMAEERSLLFVPPYDNPYIVAGQGTVGLEILEQHPDVETVLVPAGGGGLLAGVAVAVKGLRPDVRVIGIQARAMPGIMESLTAGHPVAVPALHTLADGAGVAGPSALTLGLIERYVDDVVAVSEEAIAQAVLLLIERSRLIVEGAGALAIAALLTGAASPQGRTVAILSGGNIDVNVLGQIVERGLVLEGRHRELTIAAVNAPGEMARISRILADAGANILTVDHDEVVHGLPLGVERLNFMLEVADNQAFERVMGALLAAGMQRGTLTDLATPAAAAMPS